MILGGDVYLVVMASEKKKLLSTGHWNLYGYMCVRARANIFIGSAYIVIILFLYTSLPRRITIIIIHFFFQFQLF